MEDGDGAPHNGPPTQLVKLLLAAATAWKWQGACMIQATEAAAQAAASTARTELVVTRTGSSFCQRLDPLNRSQGSKKFQCGEIGGGQFINAVAFWTIAMRPRSRPSRTS